MFLKRFFNIAGFSQQIPWHFSPVFESGLKGQVKDAVQAHSFLISLFYLLWVEAC